MKKFLLIFLAFYLQIHASLSVFDDNSGDNDKSRQALLLVRKAEENLKANPKGVEQLLKEALKISAELKDSLAIAHNLFLQGEVEYLQGNNISSIKLYEQSAGISIRNKDPHNVGVCYNRIGMVTRLMGRFDLALKKLIIAMEYFSGLKDSLGIASTCNELGLVYRNIGDIKSALEYYKKAYYISINNKLTYETVRSLNYLGSFYYYKNDLDNALFHYREAKKHAEEYNNLDDVYAGILNNIGNIYRETADYKQSLEYYLRSIEISNKLGDKNMQQVTYKNIGILHKQKGEYSTAIEFLTKADNITTETGALRIKRDILLHISDCYEHLNDLAKSLYYQRMYQTINDSIFNEDMNQKVAVYTLEYENEKRKNELKEKELGEQILFRNLSIVLLALTIIALVIVGRFYVHLRKSNKQISMQKFELEKLNVEMEGKNAKLAEFEDIINRSNVLIIKRNTENYYPVIFASKNFHSVVQTELDFTRFDTIIHPEDLLNYKDEIQKNLSLVDNEFYFQFRILSGKGYIWFISINKVVEDISGRYLQSIILNVNERRELESKLSKINQELEKRNIEKDKFFSIIAHDLKSPFLGLLGLSGLLKDEYDMLQDNTRKRYIKNINRQLKNVYSMIENLLDWSRLQMKKYEVDIKPNNIRDICDKIIEIISLNAEEKNIEIKNLVSRGMIQNTDEKMLTTILSNLINNSIKYSHDGGTISISSKAYENEFTITVEDNGVGMDLSTKTNFLNSDIFTSKKGTSGELGTGLGLTIVKEMVEKLNGSIYFESEENIGTKIFLIFPNI